MFQSSYVKTVNLKLKEAKFLYFQVLEHSNGSDKFFICNLYYRNIMNYFYFQVIQLKSKSEISYVSIVLFNDGFHGMLKAKE